jgi:acetyl-CoA synthetase
MADNAKTAQTAEELEQLLNELGEVETFAPPPEFRARARITDPDVYAAAARDPEAYWAERARELHWDTPFTKVLDESNAPFVTWFADGTLNASYNCLDRHVEAGLGDASPITGAARRARNAPSPTRPPSRRAAPGQRPEGPRYRQGGRGRDLPADDSRGRRRDARLRPDRRSAQRGLRRLRPGLGAGAHGGVAREGAHHRRRRPAQGQDRSIKQEVDRVMSGLAELRSIVVVRHTGTECAMQDGRDVFYDELLGQSEPVCPAEPLPASIRCSSCTRRARRRSRRASCTPPAGT